MLSRKLAQNIVDKMMGVIPHNVNIMNSKGVIIGSGDACRIGKVHNGAIQAIKKNDVIEIHEETEEIKCGVNIPIYFRSKLVGTVGITGDVKDVKQFASIVSITTELLISQEYSINEHIIKEKLKEEFLYEWINYKKNYDEDFIEKGKSYSIDILRERIALTIEYKEEKYNEIKKILYNTLDNDEYIIHLSQAKLVVLLIFNKYTEKKIDKLYEKLNSFNELYIGIGNKCENIYSSIKQSSKSIEIGKKIFPSRVQYKYIEVAFIHELESIIKKEDIILKKICEYNKNNDLLDTFLAYMECNGERTNTSKKIHIHRNTLNYRLEKIEEITNLSFNNYIDLLQFTKSYLNYKLS